MSSQLEPPIPVAPGRLAFESLLVFVLVLAGMLRSIHDVAVVWDEGMTFERQALLETGLRTFREQGPVRGMLDRYWRFSREEPDGHGPFYALLSLGGSYASSWFLGPTASLRFGGALLFAVTVTAVYATLRRRWSLVAATTAAAFVATMPRVVPEVSTAIIDGPLFCLAILAWCAFVAAVERRSWLAAVGFGVCIGCAMATKLTGWFLPIPYIVWTVLRLDRAAFVKLFAAGLVAAAVCLALNVGWWPHPYESIQRYFQSNLTRRDTIPIPILFLGARYDFSLPWYNTLVWTVVAVPVGTMLLGFAGVAFAVVRGRRDPIGLLLLLNWLLLMIVRALPQAPGHDGTRQIIISFGFLAMLAGYAVERIRAIAADGLGSTASAILAAVLGIGAIAESTVAVARYHPLELSYYSPMIGGLPGAERAGFEPTYFWDAVTPDVLDWLNDNTNANEWVLFRHYTPSFEHLRATGRLRMTVDPRLVPFAAPRWFVLQHRPGLYTDADHKLLAEAKPAFQKRLFGVPLISVYSGEDWQRIYQGRQQLPGGPP